MSTVNQQAQMLAHAKTVAEAKQLVISKIKCVVKDDRRQTRVYFWPVGESVMENFMIGRRIRPVVAMKALIPAMLTQLGMDPATRFRWSQKAGCSCGCSPGFVADRTLRDSAGGAVDIHVDFTVSV